MPPYCTCGAELPEDARFCHRCGRPLGAEAFEVAAETPSRSDDPASSPNANAPQAITFSNPLAVSTAFLVASLTAALAIVPWAFFVAPLVAGFVSVLLYSRRSGRILSLKEGAKLGWLTALINAILMTLFVTLVISLTGGGDWERFREQLRHQAVSPEQQYIQQQLINAPWFMGAFVLCMWLFLFALSSALHVAGGALGARFSRLRAS